MDIEIKVGDKIIIAKNSEIVNMVTTDGRDILMVWPKSNPGKSILCIGGDDPYCYKQIFLNGLEVRIGALPVDGGKIGFFGQTPSPRRVIKKMPTGLNLVKAIAAIQDLQVVLSNLGLVKLEP
jgi:hypothetical protein